MELTNNFRSGNTNDCGYTWRNKRSAVVIVTLKSPNNARKLLLQKWCKLEKNSLFSHNQFMLFKSHKRVRVS